MPGVLLLVLLLSYAWAQRPRRDCGTTFRQHFDVKEPSLSPLTMWEFPTIRGTFLGVPIFRILIFLGSYLGPLILGNYHVRVLLESNEHSKVLVPKSCVQFREAPPQHSAMAKPFGRTCALVPTCGWMRPHMRHEQNQEEYDDG